MPNLEEFEASVKQHIKLLAAKDAKTRRQAAQWLGEAGDPTAITMLAQVYKNDPDSGVREKAGYALGMFRKLEQELSGPNSEKVMDLLQEVALNGKMGGQSFITRRGLVKLELGLLISAVLVAVLSFVLPSVLPAQSSSQNNTAATLAPSPADKDRTTLLTEIRQTWVTLAGDANTLQQQFQAAQGGTALDCTIFLNAPPAYDLSFANRSAYADIAEVVDILNSAQSTLSASESAFQQACDTGGTLAPDAAGQEITKLQNMMNTIPEIGQKLAAAEAVPTSSP